MNLSIPPIIAILLTVIAFIAGVVLTIAQGVTSNLLTPSVSRYIANFRERRVQEQAKTSKKRALERIAYLEKDINRLQLYSNSQSQLIIFISSNIFQVLMFSLLDIMFGIFLSIAVTILLDASFNLRLQAAIIVVFLVLLSLILLVATAFTVTYTARVLIILENFNGYKAGLENEIVDLKKYIETVDNGLANP